jgi:hypothetical protein
MASDSSESEESISPLPYIAKELAGLQPIPRLKTQVRKPYYTLCLFVNTLSTKKTQNSTGSLNQRYAVFLHYYAFQRKINLKPCVSGIL